MHLNRRRRDKKHVSNHHPLPLVAGEQINTTWPIDFMSDALWDGRRFRAFNVIDDFTREALAVEIDMNLPAALVIEIPHDGLGKLTPVEFRIQNELATSGLTWH
jgi:putative transposase